ncbi:MAG: glycosyltransferase [Ilumatobacteraceae bacterium]
MTGPTTALATTIVVPCHDESARLDPAALVELAERAAADLVLVDDGSTDGTGDALRALAAASDGRIRVLALPRNVGKGEAVRLGMHDALDGGAALTGYFDADVATPPAEMARLVAIARERPELAVVMGARVGLLGHRVERSMVRHYLGRVFATASSLVLHLDVYDTQCGAKVFRDSPALRAALARPFTGRWVFDVELLGRLHRGGIGVDEMLEVPLGAWRDVAGSKLGLPGSAAAGADLVRVARALRRWPD